MTRVDRDSDVVKYRVLSDHTPCREHGKKKIIIYRMDLPSCDFIDRAKIVIDLSGCVLYDTTSVIHRSLIFVARESNVWPVLYLSQRWYVETTR